MSAIKSDIDNAVILVKGFTWANRGLSFFDVADAADELEVDLYALARGLVRAGFSPRKPKRQSLKRYVESFYATRKQFSSENKFKKWVESPFAGVGFRFHKPDFPLYRSKLNKKINKSKLRIIYSVGVL